VEENKSFTDLLKRNTSTTKPAPPPLEKEDRKEPDDEEDVGPCAAIAKNKAFPALTIKYANKDWESYQYRYMAVRSTFRPSTQFEILFVGDNDKWKITVTGRNLERLYNLTIQHRLEWIRPADRDFGDENIGCVTSVEASAVAEDYVSQTEDDARRAELTKAFKRPRGTEPGAGR
jgi:hypothetical protein